MSEEQAASISDKLDKLHECIEDRFNRIESRLDKLESRMDDLESKMSNLSTVVMLVYEATFPGKIDELLSNIANGKRNGE